MQAVQALRVGRKVVIVDGVGYPAVGSVCGVSNAAIAATLHAPVLLVRIPIRPLVCVCEQGSWACVSVCTGASVILLVGLCICPFNWPRVCVCVCIHVFVWSLCWAGGS